MQAIILNLRQYATWGTLWAGAQVKNGIAVTLYLRSQDGYRNGNRPAAIRKASFVSLTGCLNWLDPAEGSNTRFSRLARYTEIVFGGHQGQPGHLKNG